MRKLRGLGLHLAVDDFGTGYSSLTYLKRFPVEAIKIDRSFVAGLGLDNEDTTIVEAVVNLGHSFGLDVIAEGSETPLQLARLRTIGCDRGQGYLFGRPRPAIDHRERALGHLTAPRHLGKIRVIRRSRGRSVSTSATILPQMGETWELRTLLADLDGERRRHGGLAADPSSSKLSTRKLERSRAASNSPTVRRSSP